MTWFYKSFSTSIGKKQLMAVTGLALIVFLVLHLGGNLLIFLGPEAFNGYAQRLEENPLLIPAEIALLLLFIAHVLLALIVSVGNRKARPSRYARKAREGGKTIASSTMLLSGSLILLFIVIHLINFKFASREGTTLYHLVIDKFHSLPYVCWYVAAMVVLAFHVGHGFQSAFRTLGFVHPKYTPALIWVSKGLAVAFAVGYGAIPIWAYIFHEVRAMTVAPPNEKGIEKSIEKSTGKLDAKVPGGPIEKKWEKRRFELKLVNPANKRKFEVIVVGTGLAGASAAASLAELGYHVKSFCIQDSPRRAHSIAAQGGINAAKNYANDGDSVYRLFYDTVKGGDYRAREANVYRLADVSGSIIDQCVAQGVPFAREYGGLLTTRSFGGAQVSRTFYARGQTGQQLLLGAYGALMRQVAIGKVKVFPRTEMLELVVANGAARGIVTRNLVTGRIESHAAHAVVLATGGYGNAYYLSTNAKACNVTAIWRAHRKGALLANPCFTQIHPTCIPVHGTYQSKLTLMSESLRNDGRIWVPKKAGDHRPPSQIPEGERDYFLERKYPSFGNLVPRDVASRNVKEVCDQGKGVGSTGQAVYLDFSDAKQRLGVDGIREKYGNLFDMYQRITGENPYESPMRIYPAIHYTMGGLWVDYDLMSNLPGLFVIGEANFSDHGANRLGASALMQGLADGYFILPYTIGGYLAGSTFPPVNPAQAEFRDGEAAARERIEKLLSLDGKRTVNDFHRELGLLLWNRCGMSRNEPGLLEAKAKIPAIRAEFWENVTIPGSPGELNQVLEHAGRVADFLEFADLLVEDALVRRESCGGHFREESQTPDNEALRDDERFCHVAAWEFAGVGEPPVLHKEPLVFEHVKPSQRSYK